MKAIVCILGILFITNSNYAQKFDCASKITEYQELLKVKKMPESFAAWSDVRKNCPKETEAIYSNISTAKKMVIFENSGHESLCEKEPQKWIAEVTAFLGQSNVFIK